MTSVERVIEYSNLEPEAALDSEKEKQPPKNWPSQGHITYKNVNLKYSPDEPPVLKNLNFEIYPEEKVGTPFSPSCPCIIIWVFNLTQAFYFVSSATLISKIIK